MQNPVWEKYRSRLTKRTEVWNDTDHGIGYIINGTWWPSAERTASIPAKSFMAFWDYIDWARLNQRLGDPKHLSDPLPIHLNVLDVYCGLIKPEYLRSVRVVFHSDIVTGIIVGYIADKNTCFMAHFQLLAHCVPRDVTELMTNLENLFDGVLVGTDMIDLRHRSSYGHLPHIVTELFDMNIY